MEQVEEICDHIFLVNKGKKILDGSVNEVKHRFKENLFRIGFEKLPEIADTASFEMVGKADHSFIVKIRDGHQPNDVLGHFINQGIQVHLFNELLPSLNSYNFV